MLDPNNVGESKRIQHRLAGESAWVVLLSSTIKSSIRGIEITHDTSRTLSEASL